MERSDGVPAGRTLADDLLLRGRTLRLSLNVALKPENQLLPCLGYAVLAGLHGKSSHDADFIDEYVDADGRTIVRVTVRYHDTYTEGK